MSNTEGEQRMPPRIVDELIQSITVLRFQAEQVFPIRAFMELVHRLGRKLVGSDPEVHALPNSPGS